MIQAGGTNGQPLDQFGRRDDFKASNMIQMGELDPNTVIWRYLPFNRFTSLVEFGALWFSRLRAFNDLDEGMTPALPRRQLKSMLRFQAS